MWQMEDLLRACRCDMEVVKSQLQPNFPEADRKEEEQWMQELCDMMHREAVTEHGHLQINKNVLQELTELHNVLLASPKFPYYSAAFYNALPFIVELRQKRGEGNEENEIETCFNALYGVMMLRLQKKEISPNTAHAVKEISTFIGMLSDYYKKDKEEGLHFAND